MLSRLGNPFCPGFPTGNARPGQMGVLFCPGSGNRDKKQHQPGQKGLPVPRGWRTILSRLVLPTGTKALFFHVLLFSILFLFQLYFCISIKLMYWNSVYKISTNIYIYIVTYIIFVLDSFHILAYPNLLGKKGYVVVVVVIVFIYKLIHLYIYMYTHIYTCEFLYI